MTGFLIREFTHQGSARLHVLKDLYTLTAVALTSNVTGVEYCLGVVFNKEHDSPGTVISL